MRPRIAFAITHPITASVLLRGQLRFLQDHGFDVTVIASAGPELTLVREREGVETLAVSMSRNVDLREGPRAMAEMLRALRRARPDLLNASTPKAGLLAILGATMLRVRSRLYLVRGTLIETRRGLGRLALGAAERAATGAAHHVVFVSETLRAFYLTAGLVREDRASVIPSNGIDLSRFKARAATRAVAHEVRRRLGIAADAKVVGFVGRLVTDKGVADMIAALERVSAAGVQATFLVVGGDLAGDKLPRHLEHRLRALPRVIFTGRVDEPAPYYSAMDVLLFPSYREGLPNVPLEAAASEVPTVGYRVTGVRDAVEDGVSGSLVERGNTSGLGDTLAGYLSDDARRIANGRAARMAVVEKFEQQHVWTRWLALYERLLVARR